MLLLRPTMLLLKDHTALLSLISPNSHR